MGGEFFALARRLRPKAIIGYEFFNYARAWEFVRARLHRQGIQADFIQTDLRNALPPPSEPCDVLVSFAVLEHLRDMRETLSRLQPILTKDGLFAALWGPMWYSFSGDHIAAEIGFDSGYEHVIRAPGDYLEWYKQHPRNRDGVQRGEPTWLELGLHNFARYDEYIAAIRGIFGSIRYLQWQISTDAFRWRDRFPNKWRAMLLGNPHLQPLDLVLGGAACIASRGIGDASL